jgi:hypothetical protein
VNFIDEKDVMTAQVCQNSRKVASTFDGWTGCRLDVYAYLGGNNMGEAGLAESGRSVEKDVVDRLAPTFSGGNRYLQVILRFCLTDKICQAPRPETIIEG